MKKLLAIDTSTDLASVAITFENEIFTKTNSNVKQHADCILPLISELLQEVNLSFKDLNGVVFGCGPGSFTGIRVSCSIAKALAYGHDLPLYPVTSLHAIAYGACEGNFPKNASLLTLLDARMQEFYWQCFSSLDVGAPAVASLDTIKIDTVSNLIIAGPNIKLFMDGLSQQIIDKAYEIKDVYPTATHMIKLVQAGYIKSVDSDSALPLYVRNKIVSGVTSG